MRPKLILGVILWVVMIIYTGYMQSYKTADDIEYKQPFEITINHKGYIREVR